jgi:WD40 repeat protein
VVRQACSGTADEQCAVLLRFPFAEGGERTITGRVVEVFPDPEQDIAFIQIEGDITGTSPVPLGAGSIAGQRAMCAYGFPAKSRDSGRWADGRVVAESRPTGGSAGSEQPLIQLDASAITTGFSGGPVLDMASGMVIGMVRAIEPADQNLRGMSVAWAIPARTLQALHPGLHVEPWCPYRGLMPFTAQDADQFQGRAVAVSATLRPLAEGRRLVLLLGPSGSGKSSIVQAGVLPALAGEPSGPLRTLLVPRPGSDLLGGMEQAGLHGATANGLVAAVCEYRRARQLTGRIVIAVDQFEELLAADATQPTAAAARQIMELKDSAEDAAMILVVRDDFYAQLAATAPELLRASLPGTVNIPARLDRDSLVSIIQPPGARTVPFDPGLVDRIIRDVTSLDDGAHPDTAPATMLPALELTLTQLWEDATAEGRGITHDAYERMQGVAGGFVSWGEDALRGLTGPQREAAGRMLACLVRPADERRGIPATRVRRSRTELRLLGSPPGQPPETLADPALDALIKYRVLVTARAAYSAPGDDAEAYVELIHDSLLQQWGQLNDWVIQNQQFNAWLNHAEEARRNWADSGEQDEDLLTGTVLSDGLHWQEDRSLSDALSTFLARSLDRQQRLAAERAAAARRRRRVRRISLLTVVMAVVLVAGIATLWQQQVAASAQAQAKSERAVVESASFLSTDSALAAYLAVYAYRQSPTQQARNAVEVAADLPLKRLLKSGDGQANAVAFIGGGSHLATGYDDGQVVIWNTGDDTRTVLRNPHEQTGGNPVESIALSSAGDLAAGFANGHVAVWSAPYSGDPKIIAPPPAPASPACQQGAQAWSLAFAADRRLVVAYNSCAVGLYTAPYGGSSRYFHPGFRTASGTCEAEPVTAVAISGNGRLAVGMQQDVFIYPITEMTSTCPRSAVTLTGHTATVSSVGFNPDGSLVASSAGKWGLDRTVLVQRAEGPARTYALNADNSPVNAVAFNPADPAELVAAEAWGHVRLWNYRDNSSTAFGTGRSVLAVAFTRQGMLASGDTGGTAALWSLPSAVLMPASPVSSTVAATIRQNSAGSQLSSVAMSPDGIHFASAASGDRFTQLWGIGEQRPADISLGTCGGDSAGQVTWVTFTNDNHLLSASWNGVVGLWDVARKRADATICAPGGPIYRIAVSKDGRLAALATGIGAQIWDISNPDAPRPMETMPGGDVRSVAFSPDGETIATGDASGTVQLWKLSDPAQGRQLTTFGAYVPALAFSPDGRQLAAGSFDNRVQIWNAKTLSTLYLFIVSSSPVTDLAYSYDSHILATSSDDGIIRLWNPVAGDELWSIPATPGRRVVIGAVAFNPQRTDMLLDCGQNYTLQLWHIKVPDQAGLTPEQQIANIENATS